MTRAAVNRVLLTLVGLACVGAGLWLLLARYHAQVLPGRVRRYVATGPDRPLAGPAVRTHLHTAVHGWWLPISLAAVCSLALLYLLWQHLATRPRALRLGSAHVEARSLARQIAADAERVEGVDAARAHFVSVAPPRLRLVLRPNRDAAPADVLARVRDRLVPRINEACTGATPRVDVRFTGSRPDRGRPARVR